MPPQRPKEAAPSTFPAVSLTRTQKGGATRKNKRSEREKKGGGGAALSTSSALTTPILADRGMAPAAAAAGLPKQSDQSTPRHFLLEGEHGE